MTDCYNDYVFVVLQRLRILYKTLRRYINAVLLLLLLHWVLNDWFYEHQNCHHSYLAAAAAVVMVTACHLFAVALISFLYRHLHVLHFQTTLQDNVNAAYYYKRSSLVCLSACLSFGRSITIVSPAKTAEPIEMPFVLWTQVGLRKHVLDGGTHWRHLPNTIKPSMHGGDAALCQITLITCYSFSYLAYCVHLCFCIQFVIVTVCNGL